MTIQSADVLNFKHGPETVAESLCQSWHITIHYIH